MYRRSAPTALTVAALLVAGACTQLPNDVEGSQAVAQPPAVVEIRKSPNDQRNYRYLVLPNKLRVVLVSDPTTEKAAAALTVFRGSQHEPEGRAGLAHFLEHMLFIQTEAYPEIDGFQSYIAANGGSTNAYTALDHTNYFFDVRPAAFGEALDRFAQFFIAPIISAEYSAREKNAVHSEYQMQMKDDGWRGYMVGKQAINPQHPASRFTIGSLDSLAGDIHEDLIEFFEAHYSADQMALVALSDQSLDDMQQWIAPLFGDIVNNDIGPAHPTVPMYTADQLPARLNIQTVKDGWQLGYLFPMPSTRPLYHSKPQQYFANLLGHEGQGSLYQYLKAQGWIESLGAGMTDMDHNSSALSITLELTESGRHQTDTISALLFQYIDMLRNLDPQEWLYQEQATVAAMNFRFQEQSRPMGLVYQLAPSIDDYPPRELLVAPYLMEAFDAEKIRELMDYLRPDNVLVSMRGPGISGESVEPWFEVPYTLRKGTENIAEIDPAPLALPQPNPFLPEDLALKAEDGIAISKPVDTAKLQLWLDTDTRFGSPRASLYLQLAVENGLTTPRDRAMAQLYRSMVEDSLSELVYPAYLAGMGYNLAVPHTGFEIHIGGYHDKQTELLQPVVQALMSAPLKQARFDTLKASLIRDWHNAAKERPFRQTYSAVTEALHSGRFPPPQLIAALEHVTLNDLQAWRDSKLAGVAARGLLHGNVDGENLAQLRDMLNSTLPLSDNDFLFPQVRDIASMLRLQLPVDHNDAAMVIHVQDADESLESRALSSLAAQIIQPQYFQELRTEQQLGYVVSATNRPIVKRGGITFIVQSPSTSAQGLEQATLKFIDDFVSAWPDADPDEFEQHKAGLLNRLLEAPKNLNEQSQRYWGDLVHDIHTFDQRQQIAARVRTLTMQDMAEYFASIQQKLASKRLLVFTRGGFDEVPLQGILLDSATDTRADAR